MNEIPKSKLPALANTFKKLDELLWLKKWKVGLVVTQISYHSDRLNANSN